MGIKQSEVMAIGDAENDLSMIEFAGTGIAMGNASETIKAAADYTVASLGVKIVLRAFDEIFIRSFFFYCLFLKFSLLLKK